MSRGKHIEAARPRGTIVRAIVLAAALGLAGAQGNAETASGPVVFAAASTMAPLGLLARTFSREHKAHIELSFAASSTLARQIIHGARAGIFLSANREWMDHLERAGLLKPDSRRVLTGNRLILVRLEGENPGVFFDRPASLLSALGDLPLLLADPAHVPAGMYAAEALRHYGLWEPLQGRLAFAANARAVAARVVRGEAPLGITYASELHGASGLEAAAVVPQRSHSPIRYETALIEPAGNPAALAFYDYLFTAKAQGVFRTHGFTSGSASLAAEGVPHSTKAETPPFQALRARRPHSEQR